MLNNITTNTQKLIAVCLIVLGGCGNGSDNAPTDAPGYAQLHEAIFSKGCAVSACHGGDKGIGGLSFETATDSYTALIGVAPTNGAAAKDGYKLVDPSNLENSFLWWKLTATSEEIGSHGYGAGMPLGAFDAPGPKSLAAIKAWIQAGSPMDGVHFEADWATDPGEANYVQCEATDEAGLKACFGDPPDPATTLRFTTPPLTLKAGTEHIYCSRLDVVLDSDIIFHNADGAQMVGGHHAAVYVSMAPEDGFDPVDCDDIDMGAMRFVTGAGGAGGQNLALPEGVGLRIRKGEQLIIQSHYINTGSEERVVMDAVDLVLSPPDSNPTIADAFSVVDSGFSIPPGATQYERVKECMVDRDLDIHLLLGHTHDYGVLFDFELLLPDAEPQLLYHATDGPMLRDTPEIIYYDPPLHLNKGDKVRMTCRWDNTTPHDLSWPEEMCVAFMYYSPGEGFLICDTDNETPVLLGGGGEGGCAKPDDAGNNLGVGRYCTDGGGECEGQEANFCIAGFSDENYCTVILCQDDSVCGEDATCVSEGPGSACVPTHCQ